MQILHPFAGSIQQYRKEISEPDRYRPDRCPQCDAKQPLTGHGFYRRTLVDAAFDGCIQVRRYLCRLCKRTVSLLPEFALPWLRFSIPVISLFLVARLLQGLTLAASGLAARQPAMPYQRGQFWIRRFRQQAPALSLALASRTAPAVVQTVLRGPELAHIRSRKYPQNSLPFLKQSGYAFSNPDWVPACRRNQSVLHTVGRYRVIRGSPWLNASAPPSDWRALSPDIGSQ